MIDEYEHGSLRSKCEICERDGVIEELRARLERAEGLLQETEQELQTIGTPLAKAQAKRLRAFLRGD